MGKCTTKCKIWSRQTHLARGQKPIHELYPIIMAIRLVPTGSMSLLHHIGTHNCPNLWWEMNLPTLKEGIHCYISYIMLLPLGPRAINQRKIIKGKNHIKKGGKIKVGAPHVPQLLPPIHYKPKCGLPFY